MIWTDKPCLVWTGPINNKGYGRRWEGYGRANRRHGYVHRQAWTAAFGQIPAGNFVLHRCDNRRCYEVTHLYLGDHAQNMADMAARKRSHSHGGLFGETNPAAKLTATEVAEIRRSSASVRALAEKYGVGKTTIRSILDNRSWRQMSGRGTPAGQDAKAVA